MPKPVEPTHGLARIISKRGYCSRTQAERLIRAGSVCVDGSMIRDPESRTHDNARIAINGVDIAAVQRRYLMLNKPRGLVTTTSDQQGRATVYRAFADAGLPWVAAVGRLDKASEGLLLFSNDSGWAARITAPEASLDKVYHVQVDAVPDDVLIERLVAGVNREGERLAAKSARVLRHGEKNAWLKIVLDEGRNRQIRRLLDAFDVSVLRLVRVAIGSLALGDLGKGKWRELERDEVEALASTYASAHTPD